MNTRSATLALCMLFIVACVGVEPNVRRSGFTSEQLEVLDDAPPPPVLPLPHFRPPGDRVAARAQARRVLIAGGVLSSIGAALLLSGGITYGVPSTCDTNKDWFCDLGQQISGIAVMSVGAASFAVGTIVLGVGGYDALAAGK